jgi:hypothetical protein
LERVGPRRSRASAGASGLLSHFPRAGGQECRISARWFGKLAATFRFDALRHVHQSYIPDRRGIITAFFKAYVAHGLRTFNPLVPARFASTPYRRARATHVVLVHSMTAAQLDSFESFAVGAAVVPFDAAAAGSGRRCLQPVARPRGTIVDVVASQFTGGVCPDTRPTTQTTRETLPGRLARWSPDTTRAML